MRVLILEPHASGHHASYLRWLVQAARRIDWQVVIATTEGAISHAALATIASEFGDVEIHLIREFAITIGMGARSLALIRRQLNYWRMFKRAVCEVQASSPVDFIILPYVDYCFFALAILGAPFKGTPWCGISMRLAVTDSQIMAPESLPWKWRLAKCLLGSANLKALFVINPSVSDVPANWFSVRESSKLRYLPDPAECDIPASRSEARATLGIASNRVAILIFGSIDQRKGVESLIAVLGSRADLGEYVVILAGEQTPHIRSQLASPGCARLRTEGRIIVLDRFISDVELGSLLAASDVVWVGYQGHVYMSGVLVLAGKAGLPVIGTDIGEIGRLIRRHSLGLVAKIHRPDEVALALRRMLEAALREEMGRRSKAAFADHSIEVFGARVMAAYAG
jgi:glycosyltransferase involved in cell wall biosynthesis